MRRAIEDFESGAINLRRLVAEIEGLNAALENPDSAWRGAFHDAHLKLEQVNAQTIIAARNTLTDDEIELVANVLVDLKRALQ